MLNWWNLILCCSSHKLLSHIPYVPLGNTLPLHSTKGTLLGWWPIPFGARHILLRPCWFLQSTLADDSKIHTPGHMTTCWNIHPPWPFTPNLQFFIESIFNQESTFKEYNLPTDCIQTIIESKLHLHSAILFGTWRLRGTSGLIIFFSWLLR